MADFIPANIIQTPDFGQLAKERIDRKRQEETSKNAFIDQFEQAQGMYLEGDTQAVQGAWDNVQKTIDLVAENDSPEMRRKLKEAYGEYSKVAGTAQVLADQHREQVANYKSDPTKFAMGGSEFFKWDEDFRLKRRSYNDMVASLDNPNVLPSSGSYALLNPYDQAKTLMADTSAVAASFYDNNGVLDADGLRSRAADIARKRISASPEAVERAIIWGATSANNPKSGFAGDGDGKINSLEELEMIKNLPEEERQNYFNAYVDALVEDYMGLTPGQAATKESGKKKLATDSVSLQAAGGENVDFITLPGDVNGITQIGSAPNGEIFVTVEERVKTGEFDDNNNEIYETNVEYRPATQTEVSKVMSKYGNTYDFSALNRTQEKSQTQTATKPKAEQPAAGGTAEKPKDTLGLGIFNAPEATEAATGSAEVATTEAPAQGAAVEAPTVTYDQWNEDNKEQIEIVSSTIDDVNAQLDNPETASTAPNMFKEASRAYEDIKNTRKEIDDAKKEGRDTTELEKILEVQVNTVKRINETNKKWSENSKETSKQQEAIKEVEQAAVDAANEGEREYIIVGGKPYFKDDYAKIAGTKTGKGNYPETFEEYAKAMDVDVLNTKDSPLSTGLDEVTVTAERIDPPVSKEAVVPVQAGGVAPVERSEEEESAVVDIIGSTPSLKGAGKPDSKHVYVPREGAIAPAAEWEEASGAPAPSKNPSSKSAPSYYLAGEAEGTEWTAETVKRAMDRWNTNIPVAPEAFIKAANTFGIPVEFMIALAAKEGSIGVGDRQMRTKNFFNWGNSTKGDKLPPGPEQDKYNKYFETWEDGLMAWADGLVRMYRPDDGDWSKLWEDDEGFVTQRSGDGFVKGTRYATSEDQEEVIREIIKFSIPKQLTDKGYIAKK